MYVLRFYVKTALLFCVMIKYAHPMFFCIYFVKYVCQKSVRDNKQATTNKQMKR